MPFLELPLRTADIEVQPEDDAKGKVRKGGEKRHRAGRFGIKVETRQCRRERHQQHQTEDRKTTHHLIPRSPS